MAVHYHPGIGVIYFTFWPLQVLTPAWLDRAESPFVRRVERRLELLGLVRSGVLVDRDV